MKRLLHTLLLSLAALAVGCAAQPTALSDAAPPATQYDSVLVNPENARILSLPTLAEHLASYDVVVVGELHGHHASHWLQSRLQTALHERRPEQVLTLEPFNLDHQSVVDAYLRGDIGETALREDAEAWENYRASYRPLMEFARQQGLPVYAANAPANTVRCIGRQGGDFLQTLAPDTRARLPDQPFLDTPGYQQKFRQALGNRHGSDAMSERMRNTYQAQLLRDNTMATRILEARAGHPEHQVLHITGTFHSEEHLGTVALLQARAPDLDIAVISPVVWPLDASPPPLTDVASLGDYLYFIQPLPAEFRDAERQRAALQARFKQAPAPRCQAPD